MPHESPGNGHSVRDPLYLLNINGQTRGPYPLSQLLDQITVGQIPPATMVWQDGWPEWRKMGDVPELSDCLRSVLGLVPPPILPVGSASIAEPTKQINSPPPFIPAALPGDSASKATPSVEPTRLLTDATGESAAARQAWDNRPVKQITTEGWFGKLLAKPVKSKAINTEKRIPKRNQYGELVSYQYIMEQIVRHYREAGFEIQEHEGFLILMKSCNCQCEDIVSLQYFGLLRFAERGETWLIIAKADVQYWTRHYEDALRYMVIAVICLLVFFPCLFCLPFCLKVKEEDVQSEIEATVTKPLDLVATNVRNG